jgi:hypothetical protein
MARDVRSSKLTAATVKSAFAKLTATSINVALSSPNVLSANPPTMQIRARVSKTVIRSEDRMDKLLGEALAGFRPVHDWAGVSRLAPSALGPGRRMSGVLLHAVRRLILALVVRQTGDGGRSGRRGDARTEPGRAPPAGRCGDPSRRLQLGPDQTTSTRPPAALPAPDRPACVRTLDAIALAYLDGWARSLAKVDLFDTDENRNGELREYFAALNAARLWLAKLEARLLLLGLDRHEDDRDPLAALEAAGRRVIEDRATANGDAA